MTSVTPGSATPAAEFAYQSPQQALDALLPRIRRLQMERIPLAEAPGRVLGEAVVADRDSPALDVSAMDGYAVRLADLAPFVTGAPPAPMPVVGEVHIGLEPQALPAGAALRIVTGAAIPMGADAVIKRELVTERERSISLTPVAASSIRMWESIRRRGENVRAGEMIIPAGREVTAPVAAALAAFGCARPLVYRQVKVGILTTGDEISDLRDQITPWQIRDSNGPALEAMLFAHGWIDPLVGPRARDDRDGIARATAELAVHCDAIILTGGVSMGARDYVPAAVQSLAAHVIFHRLPQRPGKPILGAVLAPGRPVFGLPGNPLSVMVTARRIVLPALAVQAGLSAPLGPTGFIRLRKPDSGTIALWWHRPVRLLEPGVGELVAPASSGDVAGAAASDGFVEVPPGASGEGPWPFYSWTG
ncbi:MAG: molybdopterin molybdotransferase MoeA [Phycisphaeraceae bacterium]|nr:molybdopterin molybdotransferase MoeA [Phycisphaeraceae bacterium]